MITRDDLQLRILSCMSMEGSGIVKYRDDFKIPRNPAFKVGDIVSTTTGSLGYVIYSTSITSNVRSFNSEINVSNATIRITTEAEIDKRENP